MGALEEERVFFSITVLPLVSVAPQVTMGLKTLI